MRIIVVILFGMNSSKPTPATSSAPTAPLAVVQSQQLLGGQRQIVIEHHGERYVLRETSQGKLILTK